MRDILVGIDPSFTNMGVAVYKPETKELNLKTGDYRSMITWLNKTVKLNRCYLIVENPALESNVFSMWGVMKKEVEELARYESWKAKKSMNMPGTKSIQEVQSVFARSMKYAQNVGENKAAAKYFLNTVDGLAPIAEISPRERDRYDRMKKKLGKNANINLDTLRFPTKTNQTVFNEWTGYKGRNSEHARDAATLVFNRTISWAKTLTRPRKKPKSYPSGRNDNFFLVDKENYQEE